MNNLTLIIAMLVLVLANAAVIIYAVSAVTRGAPKSKSTQLLLDTCALIDGRVIDIVKSGFVPQRLVVPQFVIAELQYLADHGDSHKRERARFGLDVVRQLQDLQQSEVVIAREPLANIQEVDNKLIALAKKYGAMLYTTDYNLNKVAQIEDVRVLNVNELAQALRPHLLPGEQIEIKVTQVGQDPTQGVGYLEDGTMVVVEQAGRKIGQRLRVSCSRILQTQAGKMMFATIVSGGQHDRPNTNQRPKNEQLQQPQPQVQPPQSQTNQQPARRSQPTTTTPQQSQQSQRTNSRQRRGPRRQTPEDSLMRAMHQNQ